MILAVIILFAVAFFLNELSKKYALKNLTYKREISKRVVEVNEEFEVNTVIENKKLLPVTFLLIKEKMSNKIEYQFKNNVSLNGEFAFHTAFMTAMPYQRIKRTYKVYATKRGRHYFNDTDITVGDLLGMKLVSEQIPFTQEIITLPVRYDLNTLVATYGDYYGDISVKRWILDDPVLTVGIREYTGFEPQKNIHWPSSLRSGKIMVKKFDYTSDNKVMVILNIEAFKPFWMDIKVDEIEKCISVARTILEDFEEEGIPYGLSTNATIGGLNDKVVIKLAGWGQQHLYDLVEILGRVDYGILSTFEETLHKLINAHGDFTTYVIITPVVFESCVEHINALKRESERLVVIALKEDNLDLLDPDILTYIERRDDN